MPEYGVLDVQGPRTWEGQYGTQLDYTLKLQGVEKPAILTLKPQTPAPQPGQSMSLTLEAHPRFEDKLKAKRESTGGMFGGARPEDPARAARIKRMHSQDMALRTITLAVELGVLMPNMEGPSAYPQSTGDLFSLIAKTADWFDKDAEEAAK